MGMNDFTPGYSEEYLAHSKGPWKKHKYVSISNGKYIYPSGYTTRNKPKQTGTVPVRYRTGHARGGALPTRVGSSPVTTGSKLYRNPAKPVLVGTNGSQVAKAQANTQNRLDVAKKDRAERSKKTARKNRYKHYGIVAKNTVAGAASKVAGAAKRTGAQLKNKAHASKYLAKAYADKAHFAALDAKKVARKVKNKAATKGRKAYNSARRQVSLTANNIKKRGTYAIRSLNARYSGYKRKSALKKIAKRNKK